MYHTWILWVMKLFARSLKQQKDEERHLLFSSGHPTAVGKDIRHLTFTSFQVEFWLVRMDTPPKINIEPENHPFWKGKTFEIMNRTSILGFKKCSFSGGVSLHGFWHAAPKASRCVGFPNIKKRCEHFPPFGPHDFLGFFPKSYPWMASIRPLKS